ncbi:MAG: flagellin [Betaproteobacteria bacterium]
MTVINTNVKSLISQNALSKNNRALSVAMEQLSTGKRINSAKDDAAGLAISSRMTSQIRGLDQAVRNGNDGISMLQTAEGALIEVTNMLQRMRELSVQAANDTYAPQDRGYLNQEYQQLKDEVYRVTRATQWNGMNILDGSFQGDEGVAGKFAFQIGANEGQTVTHTLGDIGYRKAEVATEVTTAGVADPNGSAETGKVTLSGDYAAGDIVSLDFGGVASDYTVLAADVVDGDSAATLANIASNITLPNTITGTVSGAVITYAGVASGPLSGTVSRTVVGDEAALAGIQDLDIATTPKASESLAALDIGINTINSARADIGAMINRLTYAVDNLTNVSQYTSASRSTIQDADYAKASSELARTQIIQQAATAVLAQANQQTQTVLKLLQ